MYIDIKYNPKEFTIGYKTDIDEEELPYIISKLILTISLNEYELNFGKFVFEDSNEPKRIFVEFDGDKILNYEFFDKDFTYAILGKFVAP